MGLKTVIAELPRTTPAVATNASRNITSRMVEAIAKPVSSCNVLDMEILIMEIGNLQDLNQYVLLETLDILGDLIRRYGGM